MQRPDWLVSRLRTVSIDEHGPRLSVLRQPKGPDGTKGFKKSANSVKQFQQQQEQQRPAPTSTAAAVAASAAAFAAAAAAAAAASVSEATNGDVGTDQP